eukprot:TRINITY_DN5374_c0_g1_i1.p1 TRINITY_DN5374_c0_g1~~TRINITY_DN5374_c0_g1_i1.p1  ORF type:complete len:207 (-),score=76.18 TRINITY_DN5374_c0_g1_i1:132-722(-)
MADAEKIADENYKAPEKISLDTLLNRDNDDASLQAYKKSLGLTGEVYSPSDDPRRVVIMELRINTPERPGGDIIYQLNSQEDVKAMKSKPFTLKEGCRYRTQITFRAQHEIVSGLKYVNLVYRKGVRVAKDDEMVGSFGPQKAPHTVIIPRNGYDEAPSGMLSRGLYNAKTHFVDDDKQNHLEFEYSFSIKKDWSD